MMGSFIWWSGVILASLFVQWSDGSMCCLSQYHPQEKFCKKAEIVVEVLVTSEQNSGQEGMFKPFNYYNVEISKIHKGGQMLKDNSSELRVATQGNLFSCGQIKLDVGQRYLIYGEFDENTIKPLYCGGVVKPQKGSKGFEELNNIEDFDCQCKVLPLQIQPHIWVPGFHLTTKKKELGPNECQSPFPAKSCKYRNGFCRKNIDADKCEWVVKPDC